MQAVIDFVTANPLYGAGLAVLLLVLLISVAKQAFKFALIAAVICGLYGYYLHDIATVTLAQARNAAEQAAGQAKEMLDKARDAVSR